MQLLSSLRSKASGLSLPVKLGGGAMALLLGCLVVTGGASTMWARHLANKALRGIATTVSDIDKVEGKNAALEQAVGELARQTQELEEKAKAERELRVKLQAERDAAERRAADAAALSDRLKKEDLSRVPVTTLEGARDAINRALAARRSR